MLELLLLPAVRMGPMIEYHVSLPLPHPEFGLGSEVKLIADLLTQG